MPITPGLNQLDPSYSSIGRPPAEVITQLTSGLVRIQRRIEIYESDQETPFAIDNWDARLVEGSVSVDRDRSERRSLDCLLDNTDGALKNDPYEGFWYDKILKAYWGIKYYSPEDKIWRKWETPLGVFMIDRLDEDRFPDAVKVTGRDLTKKCMVTKLASSVSFQTGLKIEDIIRSLAANCGITKFALPVTNQSYMSSLTYTRGTDRWKVMTEIADSAGYELYFLPDGSLTMRQYPDPSTSPLAWDFTEAGRETIIKYTRSSNDSRVFNHILVTGSNDGSGGASLPGYFEGQEEDNTNSVIIFAEAINTDPGSPTRVDRIGDRVLTFESDLFTTQQQAQDYADTQLRISSLEEYSISFESLIMPWLDGSDIVGITEENSSDYTPRRFLLSNFSIPLGLGSMNGTARRVTIVGSKQTTEFN